MNNYEMAVDATQTALTSQGSAMRENAEHLKSLGARINMLKTGFTEFSIAMGDAFLSGGMLAVITGLTSLAQAASEFVGEFGALPVLFLTVAAIASKMNVFERISGSIRTSIDGIRGFSQVYSREVAGNSTNGVGALSAAWGTVSTSTDAASKSARIFGGVLKSALISTGVGALAVGLGIVAEKLISIYQERQLEQEELEKLNKKMIDTYRASGDEMRDTIDIYDELSQKTKLTTEEQQELDRVTKELAEGIPTTVKYIDAQGKAHMKTTEEIEKEVLAVAKLSQEQAKLDMLNFEKKNKDRAKTYAEITGEISKLADEYERLGKASAAGAENPKINGAPNFMYRASNPIENAEEKQQQNAVKQMMKQAELTEFIQKTNIAIQEQALAYFEAEGQLSKLGDTQQSTVEKMISSNEELLRGAKNTKEFEEAQNNLLGVGIEVGDVFVKAYDQLSKGIDKNTKEGKDSLKEIEAQLDIVAKSIPDTFFQMTDEMGNVTKTTEEMKLQLMEINNVAYKVEQGAGQQHFWGLKTALENVGFTAEEAANFLDQLAIEHDNATIRTMAQKEATDELAGALSDQNDELETAIDHLDVVFGYDANTISGIESHLKNLQNMQELYGENAKGTEQWQYTMEALQGTLGLTEEEITKNIGKYLETAEAIGKIDLSQRGSNEEMKDFVKNHEDLTDKQKDLILAFINSEGKIDAFTGETRELKTAAEESSTAIGKTDEKLRNLFGSSEKQYMLPAFQDLIKKAGAASLTIDGVSGKVSDLKNAIFMPTESRAINEFIKSTQMAGGELDIVYDKVDGLMIRLSDGSYFPVSLANTEAEIKTVNTELDKSGEKVENVEEKLANPFNTTGVDGAKQSVGDLNTAGGDAITTHEELSLAYQKEIGKGFMNPAKDSISETIEEAQKFDSMTLSSLNWQNLLDVVGAANGEMSKSTQFALDAQGAMQSVLDRAGGLRQISDALGVIYESSINVKGAVDNLVTSFSNLGKDTNLGGTYDAIIDVGAAALVSKVYLNQLKDAVVALRDNVGTGQLANYYNMLKLIKDNATGASKAHQSAVSWIAAVKDIMSIATGVASAYAKAIGAVASASPSYSALAMVVVQSVASMNSAFARNKTSLSDLVTYVSGGTLAISLFFEGTEKRVVTAVDTMSKSMNSKFKTGIQQMVESAKRLPKLLGDGIGSMAKGADSGVRKLANQIGSGLEKAINKTVIDGVNEALTFMGVEKKLPKIDIPAYATGTDYHMGGLALVGEEGFEYAHIPNHGITALGVQGAEIRNLPKGTSVLPHEESMQLAKAYGLPAYATGIGDYFAQFFDKPRKLLDSIMVGLGLKDDSLSNAPNGAFKDLAVAGLDKVETAGEDYLDGEIQEVIKNMFGSYAGGMEKDPFTVGAGAGMGGMMKYVEHWYNQVKDRFGKTWFMGGFANRGVVGNAGTKSMHAYGRAFDIGGSPETMQKIANFLRNASNIQYVIYNRLISSNGGEWRKYSGLNPHTDHVHADFKGIGGTANAKDAHGFAGTAFNPWAMGTLSGMVGNGNFPILTAGTSDSNKGGGGNYGYGASKARGWLAQALAVTGQPQSLLDELMTVAYYESKYNREWINRWDSNAKNGNPSQGLMHTIPTTFKAHMLGGYGNILNPVHNAISAIRYLIDRYGGIANHPGLKSIAKGGAYRPYANGGFIDEPHMGLVGEAGREVIIPLSEQRRGRGLDLWSRAGAELGVPTSMIDYLKSFRKNSGGMSFAASSMMGATSGDSSSSSSSGGDSGSSGTIQPSISSVLKAVSGMNMQALAGTTSTSSIEQAQPLTALAKSNHLEQEMNVWESAIARTEQRMQRVNKETVRYRDLLKEMIGYQAKALAVTHRDLAAVKRRNVEIEKWLKKNSNTSKHTAEQRETYNRLVQELDSNMDRIRQLNLEIESAATEAKQQSLELFTDFINELAGKWDEAIKLTEDKIDNIDFNLEVTSLIDPDNTAKTLDLLGKKALEVQNQLATSISKEASLKNQYLLAEKNYGKDSEQAKLAKEMWLAAREEYEEYTLKLLTTEKEIKSTRENLADDAINQLKNYYSTMKDMATDAIDAEIKSLQDAHDEKMKLYDDEIDKINEVYNSKIREMDDEKSEDEFNKELAEKNEERASLVNEISLRSRDDSKENQKKLKELQEQLKTVDEDIASFQEARRDELLRQQLEDQKEAQIKGVEEAKTVDQDLLDSRIEKLELEKEAVIKKYDDILNNEKYWADMRNEFVKGNFTLLNTELTKMKGVIDNLNNGIFSGLTESFSSFSKAVQDEIIALNSLVVDNLQWGSQDIIGQVGSVSKTNPYTMTNGTVSGDKSSTITKTPVTTPVKATTPTTKPTTPTTTTPTKTSAVVHTVSKGETLSGIAKKYGTTVTKLMQLNPSIKDANKISVGQKITVSSGNTSSGGSSSTAFAPSHKTVNATGLLATASSQAKVVESLPKGSELDYLGSDGDWIRVKSKSGKIGWIGRHHLQAFRDGGSTGSWSGGGGKIGILHSDEWVTTQKQTSRMFNVDKFLDKVTNIASAVVPNVAASNFAAEGQTINVTNHYTFNTNIENLEGGKKGADTLFKSMRKDLRKLGQKDKSN